MKKDRILQVRITEEDSKMIDFLKNERQINLSKSIRLYLKKLYEKKLNDEFNIEIE
jgi:hypothetical protein